MAVSWPRQTLHVSWNCSICCACATFFVFSLFAQQPCLTQSLLRRLNKPCSSQPANPWWRHTFFAGHWQPSVFAICASGPTYITADSLTDALRPTSPVLCIFCLQLFWFNATTIIRPSVFVARPSPTKVGSWSNFGFVFCWFHLDDVIDKYFNSRLKTLRGLLHSGWKQNSLLKMQRFTVCSSLHKHADFSSDDN